MRSIYLIANKILMWLKGDRSSAAWVALVGGSLLFLLFGYGAKVTDNENLILVGFAILIVCLIFYKWNLHTANDPDFVRRITDWSTWSGWIAALCAAGYTDGLTTVTPPYRTARRSVAGRPR